MGNCDFTGNKQEESGHLVLENPSKAKSGITKFQVGSLLEEIEEKTQTPELGVEYNKSQLTFNGNLISAETQVQAKEICYDDEDEEHVEKNISILVSNEAEQMQDTKNTSMEEVVQTVHPTIVNKRKLENIKIDHPAKKNMGKWES